MSIEQLKDQIPDFAKDVRLNLASMVADETLSPQSKYGLLLATAIATRAPVVIAAMESAAAAVMTPAAVAAAKSAACVMAMNNVYYRFVHLASNPEYKSMPARLRMNVIANPGVDKADFELWSLAVSAINGCGACVDAHEKALQEAGVGSAAIQTAVRLAAIVQSVAVAIEAAGHGVVQAEE
ncbi:carboxymuconolactone decarboxylase family protein [Bradyrhizobium sp. 190]|uniref:carboxymuconolactone decarboxylase family protein n=1 Tax=unclassified Bradyrhizobium TaxID=2631580 RepID=UPI001FFA8018|nr:MULTISPECIES: carboxymuconolactone decarboxylase family protein [unclassified Bradyrhizobium]MCK1513730.1 carboxymuconolactone decarboxylase family protein [Bradyrhizobium sp. 190]UPK05711.1 carboxymuconolactone decarboxylase family protein [Bradyrhizobium sp. 170]